MGLMHLRVLLEVSAGDFHAFQCVRLPERRAWAARSLEWLVTCGLCELVGDEYFLTELGREVEGAALAGARGTLC